MYLRTPQIVPMSVVSFLRRVSCPFLDALSKNLVQEL